MRFEAISHPPRVAYPLGMRRCVHLECTFRLNLSRILRGLRTLEMHSHFEVSPYAPRVVYSHFEATPHAPRVVYSRNALSL